jgi:hypothetical protein
MGTIVNLLTNYQAYKKYVRAKHVVMPSHSVANLNKNVFKNYPRMHDELNWKMLDGILESVKGNVVEKYNSLLILNDVVQG